MCICFFFMKNVYKGSPQEFTLFYLAQVAKILFKQRRKISTATFRVSSYCSQHEVKRDSPYATVAFRFLVLKFPFHGRRGAKEATRSCSTATTRCGMWWRRSRASWNETWRIVGRSSTCSTTTGRCDRAEQLVAVATNNFVKKYALVFPFTYRIDFAWKSHRQT